MSVDLLLKLLLYVIFYMRQGEKKTQNTWLAFLFVCFCVCIFICVCMFVCLCVLYVHASVYVCLYVCVFVFYMFVYVCDCVALYVVCLDNFSMFSM